MELTWLLLEYPNALLFTTPSPLAKLSWNLSPMALPPKKYGHFIS
jgi:hypothetical protein